MGDDQKLLCKTELSQQQYEEELAHLCSIPGIQIEKSSDNQSICCTLSKVQEDSSVFMYHPTSYHEWKRLDESLTEKNVSAFFISQAPKTVEHEIHSECRGSVCISSKESQSGRSHVISSANKTYLRMESNSEKIQCDYLNGISLTIEKIPIMV